MRIHPIASSSDGNSTLIETDHTSILIDCGLSLKALVANIGLEKVKKLDAVFVTHEHGDHIRGIGPLGRRFGSLPVYMNTKSFTRCHQHLNGVLIKPLDQDDKIIINDITIQPFNVFHDTANTFGFFFEENDTVKLSYITDTGAVGEEMMEYITASNALFIESNYDEQGLIDFPDYPEIMKDRIRDTHLCNDQTLIVIEQVGIDQFSHIIMCHLSPRSNTAKWVREGFERTFPDDVKKLIIAPTSKSIVIN